MPITSPAPTTSSSSKSYSSIAKNNLPISGTMSNFNKLLSAINDFNQEYIEFVDCQAKNYYNGVSGTCKEPDVSKITKIKNSKGQKYFDLDSNDHISFNTSSVEGTDLLSDSIYQENKQSIDEFHKNIIRLRNDLDIKLHALYETNHSFLSDYKMEFDTSIYTGILWSILASSILYYVFTRM